MAARARRARPGHARRARAREGREDSDFALVLRWLCFSRVSAIYHPGDSLLSAVHTEEDGPRTWWFLPDDGKE